MNDELERMWKEVILAYSRKYPRLFLEGLKKTRKYLNQDNQ
jgi:hypothetical protein